MAGLRSVIESEEGPLAAALVPGAADAEEVFASLARRGERAKKDPEEYALLVESILEGYLLHYAASRVLGPADEDLRLLAGDYMYAFGLTRLARLDDLDGVAELSDLITLCAQAHAGEDGTEARADPFLLTGPLWALGVLAVATGGWNQQKQVKQLAQLEGTGAAKRILEVAGERAQRLDLTRELERALIAFDQAVEQRS